MPACAAICSVVSLAGALLASGPALHMEQIGTIQVGPFGTSAAEIVAFDSGSKLAFVTNAHTNSIDYISLADPTRPELILSVKLDQHGGGVNSVAVHNGLIAAAVEAVVKQDSGRVVLLGLEGDVLSTVEVGALPDMLTFTPDGRYLLVANEGEPSDDYSVDPEGSVSVIAIPDDPNTLEQKHVRTADFQRCNSEPIDPAIRIFGPGSSVAQDLEPESIAVSPDSRTAYVVCQENNALAIVDIESATVTNLVSLGFKDHSLPGHGLDASDRDGAIRIANWPVWGMYQPDTIKAYEVDGRVYLVTADEGDTRSYRGFNEEVRVRNLKLDPEAFPDAERLQAQDQLGRLQVTNTLGDSDGDGYFEQLYSFGGRGMSIRDASGNLIFDSGDDFEQTIAKQAPGLFNSNNDANDTFDRRSDDRGPEPEALALGRLDDRVYAFVGLERSGGIIVYDITIPPDSHLVGYWTNRIESGDAASGTAGDLGPEGFTFVPADQSPNGVALLLTANEVSGTLTVWAVTRR